METNTMQSEALAAAMKLAKKNDVLSFIQIFLNCLYINIINE
jgi:hypothetical protein